MMKRRLSFLLCTALVCLCVSLLSPKAKAAEIVDSGYCGGEGDGTNLTWTLDDEGILTISGKGAMVIYDQNAPWCSYTSNICNVLIENGATSIGEWAFSNCKVLTKVAIPDSVTSIETSAFQDCESLLEIQFPDSITSMGERAFLNCKALTKVTIPASVTAIEAYTFYKCESLAEVQLHDSITYIGESAFSSCDALRKIAIPNSVTTIEAFAFQGCSALTEIALPNSITSLKSHMLSGCYSLSQIVIPDSVVSIEDYALSWCWGLSEIVIPNNVMSIGYDAFYGSTPLKKLVFRGDAPTIHANAFTDFSGENGLRMDAWYPADNPTWTEDKLQDYGGDITWVPYTKDVVYHTWFSLEAIPQDEFNLKITVTRLGESADDLAMIALYSSEGQFFEMILWELSGETAQTYTLSRDNSDGKIGQVKVFIVNSLSDPVPLMNGAGI